MSQVVKQLTECNRCKAAGFPSQMIAFEKTTKTKPDGQPVWLLLNSDMSGHVHKTTQTEPTSTDVKEKHLIEVMEELISAIKVLTVAVNNRPVAKHDYYRESQIQETESFIVSIRKTKF